MDYADVDYVYITVWFVLAASLLRFAWLEWKRGARGGAGLDVCLALLLIILACVQLKKGMGA